MFAWNMDIMTESMLKKLKVTKSKSDHKHQMAAMILYKGRPLAFSHNQASKTHPITKKLHEHRTTHAELAVILKIKNKEILKNCTLVVFREDRAGNLTLAKPCETCLTIMKLFSVQAVSYSTKSGFVTEYL